MAEPNPYSTMEILMKLRFDENGLIPAIVQDASNGQVLMMAYMNEEALKRTMETGLSHFYSRSRQKLWMKGEESGHIQHVKEILYDCDHDTLLLKVDQEVATCHTGHRSCFFEKLYPSEGEAQPQVFEPEAVYGSLKVLDRIFEIILDRKVHPKPDSYTTKLFTEGEEKILKKLAEELVELLLASKGGRREEIVYEAADFLFHLLVLLGFHGIPPWEIGRELERRFGKKPEEYRPTS